MRRTPLIAIAAVAAALPFPAAAAAQGPPDPCLLIFEAEATIVVRRGLGARPEHGERRQGLSDVRRRFGLPGLETASHVRDDVAQAGLHVSLAAHRPHVS